MKVICVTSQQFRKWWLSLFQLENEGFRTKCKDKYSIVGFSDIILVGRGLLHYVFILERFVFMLATNPEGFVGEGESLKTG